MRLSELMTFSRGCLGLRIVYAMVVFLFVIYFSFNAFFVYEKKSDMQKEELIHGRQLAALLAKSVRLGVLTESPNLLKAPVEDMLQERDVILVQMFAEEGSPLLTQRRADQDTLGRPVEIIRGPITGLPLPARAEIVLEGEIPPLSQE